MNQYKAQILLVEDEPDIAELISLQLKRQGHQVTHLSDGKEALAHIQNDKAIEVKDYDLFILDRMLPGANGLEICKFIRFFNKTKSKPILFLTAMGEAEHIVEGLNAGADDYVAKPYKADILSARIESLLRRSHFNFIQAKKGNENIISHLGIKIDQAQCNVWVEEEPVQLTKSEYRLLLNFLKDPGKVFARNQLIDLIQDGPVHVTGRTIDTHIFGLRKKLLDKADFIETVRGIGYRVKN
jgi:two-component system, OmpR family, phosphate regulon response regulator PhoB